jgi:hypothetical protein
MTRVGTTQAHRNLLKTLQAGLKSTAARERLFAVIAERRVEWERLRASRPWFYGGNEFLKVGEENNNKPERKKSE